MAPALVHPVKLRVCGECRARLVARGAEHVPGPHVFDLGARCEAHGRVGALAAAHVVALSQALASAVDLERDNQPLVPLEAGDDIHDATIVAPMAVTLLAARDDLDPSSDDAIAFAVRTARSVLAAARGK